MCRACAAKVGRRRKKSNTMASKKSIMNLAKKGAGVYLGMAAGRAISNNISFVSQNPIIGVVAKLVVASQLGGRAGSLVEGVGVGLAADAISSGVTALAPGLSSQLGIAGQGSFFNFGVAGNRVNGPGAYTDPILKVE